MDVNVLQHTDVPEHHLVPEKDEKGIMKTLNAGKDQLPKIRKGDPCVKLLEEFHGSEIEEGRIIRIVRLNEVSGVSVAYRIVVRG
jgi:DNA-directed RNA polymerase subunit H